MATPEKAYLENAKTGTKYEFQFNPETYSLTKQSDWQANQKDHIYDIPVVKWKGGSAMKLELTIFFDTYEDDSDVRDKTRKVEELTLVDPDEHEPPKLKFYWGGAMKIRSGTELQWILGSFNTTYKMFNSSGIPVRAEMKISLSEYATEDMLKDRSRLQSPDHEKAYRVQPGDTLQSIAWRHYDDPSLWRPIAAANNIEDPRDVAPGTVLRVPRIR
jgi:LysM repeat protein